MTAGSPQFFAKAFHGLRTSALITHGTALRQSRRQAGTIALDHGLADALQKRLPGIHRLNSFQRSRNDLSAGAGKSRAAVQLLPGPGKRRKAASVSGIRVGGKRHVRRSASVRTGKIGAGASSRVQSGRMPLAGIT